MLFGAPEEAPVDEQARRAVERGAELVLFPELSLCGYPPRDLIEVPAFRERNRTCLQALAERTADLDAALAVGYVGCSDRSARGQIRSESGGGARDG